jgi:hypothetical protein
MTTTSIAGRTTARIAIGTIFHVIPQAVHVVPCFCINRIVAATEANITTAPMLSILTARLSMCPLRFDSFLISLFSLQNCEQLRSTMPSGRRNVACSVQLVCLLVFQGDNRVHPRGAPGRVEACYCCEEDGEGQREDDEFR